MAQFDNSNNPNLTTATSATIPPPPPFSPPPAPQESGFDRFLKTITTRFLALAITILVAAPLFYVMYRVKDPVVSILMVAVIAIVGLSLTFGEKLLSKGLANAAAALKELTSVKEGVAGTNAQYVQAIVDKNKEIGTLTSENQRLTSALDTAVPYDVALKILAQGIGRHSRLIPQNVIAYQPGDVPGEATGEIVDFLDIRFAARGGFYFAMLSLTNPDDYFYFLLPSGTYEFGNYLIVVDQEAGTVKIYCKRKKIWNMDDAAAEKPFDTVFELMGYKIIVAKRIIAAHRAFSTLLGAVLSDQEVADAPTIVPRAKRVVPMPIVPARFSDDSAVTLEKRPTAGVSVSIPPVLRAGQRTSAAPLPAAPIAPADIDQERSVRGELRLPRLGNDPSKS